MLLERSKVMKDEAKSLIWNTIGILYYFIGMIFIAIALVRLVMVENTLGSSIFITVLLTMINLLCFSQISDYVRKIKQTLKEIETEEKKEKE